EASMLFEVIIRRPQLIRLTAKIFKMLMYALYHPIGGRCSGGQPNHLMAAYVVERKFVFGLYVECGNARFARQFRHSLSVAAVFAADYYHQIDLSGHLQNLVLAV